MNHMVIRNYDISNGPGVRVSLFVSGCEFKCKGCFNKEAWDFNSGEKFTEKSLQNLLELLKPGYITGLTILGGEPLHPQNQPEVLSIIKSVKERFPQKSIWVYSGYTLEYLQQQPFEITKEILGTIDVLVDGQYISELKDPSLKFRGSSNQRIINMKEV